MKLRAHSKQLAFAFAFLNNDVNIPRRVLHVRLHRTPGSLPHISRYCCLWLYLNILATGLQSAQNNVVSSNKQYIRKVSDRNLGQDTHTRE